MEQDPILQHIQERISDLFHNGTPSHNEGQRILELEDLKRWIRSQQHNMEGF